MLDVDGALDFIRDVADMWIDGVSSGDTFVASSIAMSLVESDVFSDGKPSAEGITRWLSDMSIIRRRRGSEPGEAVFALDPAVAHSIAILDAEV